MNIVIILSSLIAGIIYMLRGGTSKFQFISKPFGIVNPETGKFKTPRWATVVMQIFVIAPVVVFNSLTLWTLLIYPAGWYLTIVWKWGDFMACDTWAKRFKMFGRMCASIALFAPLAYIRDPNWFSIYLAVGSTVVFAALTTLIYSLYTKLAPKANDFSFNWSEFLAGIALAVTSLILITGD